MNEDLLDEEKLSTNEIILQVALAFTPNHFDVNVDFRTGLYCEVFDKDQRGRSKKFTLDELGGYRTRGALGEILRSWREVLENDGYKFE